MQGSYRYFAWKESGYWTGQKLLTSSQISILLEHLAWQNEVFATIQHYDEHEEIVGCPIYADFDHKDKSLAETQADVQAFVYRIMGDLNVVPQIYFSGNKGFHVILPMWIPGNQCHYLVRHLVTAFGADLRSLDLSVYRPRAMFRLPGSPASVPGRYKVQITRDELFTASVEYIQALATERRNRQIQETDLSRIAESTLRDLLTEAQKHITTYKDVISDRMVAPMLTPCLRHFLKVGVHEGQRNKAVFILAKFFKSSGTSQEEALDILLKEPHIKEWDENGRGAVLSVLRSVYRSRRETRMGCRKGSDAELMQEHCSELCPFNPKFPDLHFKKVKL